jgi:hypothetical protein
MGLLLGKKGLVRAADAATARALAGAAYLDGKFGPGWDRAVDLDQLDIGSPLHCVLGQLGQKGYRCLPTFQRAVDCGFSCGLLSDLLALFYRPPAAARSYDLLTAAWKALLSRRRQKPTVLEQTERQVEEAATAGIEAAESRRAPRRIVHGRGKWSHSTSRRSARRRLRSCAT